MIVKINSKQSKKVNKLVRNFCCNCVDDNCLLLDDGDEHSCVQLISSTGIYCNYFLKSVLPNDMELLAELESKDNKRTCTNCGKSFYSQTKNRLYCSDCAERIKRQKAAERKRRQRQRQSEKE